MISVVCGIILFGDASSEVAEMQPADYTAVKPELCESKPSFHIPMVVSSNIVCSALIGPESLNDPSQSVDFELQYYNLSAIFIGIYMPFLAKLRSFCYELRWSLLLWWLELLPDRQKVPCSNLSWRLSEGVYMFSLCQHGFSPGTAFPPTV